MATTPGIDVSGNNGTIHWAQVARSGIKFAYIKVNEGDWKDGSSLRNAHNAEGAGLLTGGYDFARPKAGRTGAQEFDVFYQRASDLGLLRDRNLRPVLDIEATALDAAGTRRYVWSWVSRCKSKLGVYPFIYTGSWFWDGVMKARRPSKCPLWLAAYTTGWKRLIPHSFKGVSIHQYTDKGSVPGIHGHVDLDRYLSTRQHLVARHTIGNARKRTT